MTPPVVKRRCGAPTKTGGQCTGWAMRGGTRCRRHGGAHPATRRKALVRATLDDWGINEDLIDPGTQLLRLVAQSARRAAFYAELLQSAYNAAEEEAIAQTEELVGLGHPFRMPGGIAALIGKKYKVTENYGTMAVGEAIRGLVELELHERKVCADFAEKAIRAGLAERQVRLAEQQGAAIIAAITIALDRAGIVGPARLEAQDAAATYLSELALEAS
jgi:hypothetical protein